MKKDYEEIDFYPGATLNDCVNKLLEYKEKGKLVFGVFNGHKLYSDNVTMDGAYMQVIGKTKSDFDTYIENQKKEYIREQEEHVRAIPYKAKLWMDKGREVLDKDKWERWDQIVPIRLNDLYRGMELGQCLDIIKILKTGTFEDAKKELYNQGHSGMSFSLICAMIKEFSPLGDEFVSYVRE